MKKKPIIGLVTRERRPASTVPPMLGAYRTYLDGVIAAGGNPVILPAIGDLADIDARYDLCDGILLTGGEDVDPRRYGEEPEPELGEVSEERDTAELRLTQRAIQERKPILAICRGHQVLNVALGGTLIQHIPNAGGHGERLNDLSDWERLLHPLILSPESALAKILGCRELVVNSLHHQGIKQLAPGLIAVGHSPDGIIEAVEGTSGGFVIGVQCHPEALCGGVDTRWARLFERFVAEASAFSTR